MTSASLSQEMWQGACALCGHLARHETLKKHYVVPIELTRKAGMPDATAVYLCDDCYTEINTWYASNVSTLIYKPESKRFESKSVIELVREYENVYRAFAEYRKQRQKSANL